MSALHDTQMKETEAHPAEHVGCGHLTQTCKQAHTVTPCSESPLLTRDRRRFAPPYPPTARGAARTPLRCAPLTITTGTPAARLAASASAWATASPPLPAGLGGPPPRRSGDGSTRPNSNAAAAAAAAGTRPPSWRTSPSPLADAVGAPRRRGDTVDADAGDVGCTAARRPHGIASGDRGKKPGGVAMARGKKPRRGGRTAQGEAAARRQDRRRQEGDGASLWNRCNGRRNKTGSTYVQGDPRQKVITRQPHRAAHRHGRVPPCGRARSSRSGLRRPRRGRESVLYSGVPAKSGHRLWCAQDMPQRPRGGEPPWPCSALPARTVVNVIARTIDRETHGSPALDKSFVSMM